MMPDEVATTLRLSLEVSGDGGYATEVIYTLPKDADINSLAECLRGFLLAAGFHVDSVNQAIPPE